MHLIPQFFYSKNIKNAFIEKKEKTPFCFQKLFSRKSFKKEKSKNLSKFTINSQLVKTMEKLIGLISTMTVLFYNISHFDYMGINLIL